MVRTFLLILLLPACRGEPAPAAAASTSTVVSVDGLAFASSTDLVGISSEEEAPPPAAPSGAGSVKSLTAPLLDPGPQAETDPGLGVEGGMTLTSAQIKGTVEGNLAQVKACYERELKSNTGLAGKLVLGWTVGADGRVRDLETVQDGLRNRDVNNCVRRSVQGWRFPRAESPSDVEYPFILRPSF